MNGVLSVLLGHEDVLMLVMNKLRARVIESAVLETRAVLIEAPPFNLP